MNEEKFLTWDEIKAKYPDMWVTVINSKHIGEELESGIVIASSKDNKELAKETKRVIGTGLEFKGMSFLYTGEIKYQIMGMAKLERRNV
ncbi:MAG: hypothetical protein ABIA04_07075 [Pseudomonadota bacterium]